MRVCYLVVQPKVWDPNRGCKNLSLVSTPGGIGVVTICGQNDRQSRHMRRRVQDRLPAKHTRPPIPNAGPLRKSMLNRFNGPPQPIRASMRENPFEGRPLCRKDIESCLMSIPCVQVLGSTSTGHIYVHQCRVRTVNRPRKKSAVPARRCPSQ